MPISPFPQSSAPAASGGRLELVVIARADAGLRANARGVASTAAVDTAPLQTTLALREAVLRPLFGLSEDRVRAHVDAVAAAQPAASSEPVPDLSLYYSVEAPEDRLQQLAEELRADPLIDAAYIKPAGE